MNNYVFAAIALVLGLSACAQMSESDTKTITLEAHARETLKLKGRIAELEEQLRESEQARLALEQHNAELKERIEMLKVLDQAVEEKRKNYNSR